MRWNEAGSQISDNRYRYNAKEEQSFVNVPYIDYGARMYDPRFRLGWNTSDPLAEKYHPISPYAYCAGNPIKYVDPDGQDVWEINQNGEIVNRIKDKTQDAFFMVNNEGKRMEGDMYSVSFEYGTVKGVNEMEYEVDGMSYNLTLFNIAGDDNGQKLFEVMSNNQNNIEWSHTKVGTSDSGKGYVGTSHTPYKEASSLYIINNGYTIREHTHSHPNTPVPSDNDRAFHTALNNGRNVPTYIYHTYSNQFCRKLSNNR